MMAAKEGVMEDTVVEMMGPVEDHHRPEKLGLGINPVGDGAFE